MAQDPPGGRVSVSEQAEVGECGSMDVAEDDGREPISKQGTGPASCSAMPGTQDTGKDQAMMLEIAL